MAIKEILIGTLVFIVVTVILFSSAVEFNNQVPGYTPINESYAEQDSSVYDYELMGGQLANASSYAPGGSEANPSSSATSGYDQEGGYKMAASLFSSSIGTIDRLFTNIAKTFKIDKRWIMLIVAGLSITIALALISSVLLNPIR